MLKSGNFELNLKFFILLLTLGGDENEEYSQCCGYNKRE